MSDFNDKRWIKEIAVTLPALSWLTIHGTVCLGLRHPHNTGPSRKIAEDFITSIETFLMQNDLLTPEDIQLIRKTKREVRSG